jgi:hypothetical protein
MRRKRFLSGLRVLFLVNIFALDDGANSAIIHRAQSFHRPQKGWQR